MRKPSNTATIVDTNRTFFNIDRLNNCKKVRFFVYKFSLLMELFEELADLFRLVNFIDSVGWPPELPPPPPPDAAAKEEPPVRASIAFQVSVRVWSFVRIGVSRKCMMFG